MESIYIYGEFYQNVIKQILIGGEDKRPKYTQLVVEEKLFRDTYTHVLSDASVSGHASGKCHVTKEMKNGVLRLFNESPDELQKRIEEISAESFNDEQIESVFQSIKALASRWICKQEVAKSALQLAREQCEGFEKTLAEYKRNRRTFTGEQLRENRKKRRNDLLTIVSFMFAASVDWVKSEEYSVIAASNDVAYDTETIASAELDTVLCYSDEEQLDLLSEKLSHRSKDVHDPIEAVSALHTDCRLKSTEISIRPNFVREAREDIFRRLDEAFSLSHIVFLHGMGGIGKSEAAKCWAIEQKKNGRFDTVVFAQLDAEKSSVMSLLNDDTVFVLTGIFQNRGDTASAGIEESEEEYFLRKLAKIMQICDEKSLIIIDNYDIADAQLSKLYAGSYCLLVTTRNKYDDINFPFIHIGKIQNIACLKKLFFNNLNNNRCDISSDDPYIKALFELVDNHTLAVEIIAKALADSIEDTPESLYNKMKIAGMYAIDGDVESYVSPAVLSPYECIHILFNLSQLESDADYESKVQVLTFMSAIPTRGIERELLNSWSNNETNRAMRKLIKKSWLREDTVDGARIISMHPLIREIVLRDLEPSIEKCSMYIEKFKNDDRNYINGLYHKSAERKERYVQIALSLLSAFPLRDLTHFDFYCKLQRTFQICAKADEALHLANDLKSALEKESETNTLRYAYILYRIGAIHYTFYRDIIDIRKEMQFLLDAEALIRSTASTTDEKMWLIYVYRLLAKIYYRNLFDDSIESLPEKIEEFLGKGEAIAKELMEDGCSYMNLKLYHGTSLVWRSKLEIFKNNLSAAKDYLTEAESEFIRFGYINALDRCTIFDAKALICDLEGDYSEAASCLENSAEVYINGFGEYHRLSIERAISLAMAYKKSEQLPKAIELLQHYRKIAIDMYGEDAPLSVSVSDTLREIQST